jgi:Ca-activated chloride channel family protein
VTQEFDNPSSVQLEAFYYYPVPRGATVTNLALWVNGKRREARVMERQKAREIYQGIVNEKRDPALVERLSDELFRIRIFPVPARGRQRVELRFAQPLELVGTGHYRLALRRPPGPTCHVLRLGVDLLPAATPRRAWLVGYPGRLAREGRSYRLPLAATQRSFERKIEIHYTLPPRSADRVAVAARRTGEETLFVAELPRSTGRDARREVALLVDLSASMLEGARAARAKEVAGALLDALPAWSSVQLLPFDILPRQGPDELRAGAMVTASAARVRGLREWLSKQEASSGSAFVPAFEAALRAGARQIVLVTDGASPDHQAELEHLLRQIFDQRGVSVSVVLVGSTRSGAAPQLDPLRDMVRITGGVFSRRSGEADLAALARRLLARPQPRSARALAAGALVDGASLHVLPGASRRQVLVAGRVPAGLGSLQVSLADGRRRSLELPGPADPRAQARDAGALWAHAEIGRLMERIKLFSEEDKLRPRIVALSRRHRVASEYTAYLVTETDADYLRPTSGRKWQRRVRRMGDDAPAPSFHSTPEPHEVLLVGLGLLLLWAARRRGWIGAP